MKRGLLVFLCAWMVFLTVWTGLLAIAVYDREPSSVAAAAPAALDVRDPITVRWETTVDGKVEEVAPPQTMPLWQYVQGEDRSTEGRLDAFEAAFEQDLHHEDPTFHRTHELIDGRTW